MARTSTWSSLLPADRNANCCVRLKKHWQGRIRRGKRGDAFDICLGNGKVPLACFLFRTWSHGSCWYGGWLMLGVEDVAFRFTHQVACNWPVGYFSWKCNLVRNRYSTIVKTVHYLWLTIDDIHEFFRLFILFCIHVPLVWTLLSLLYVMVNKPILVAGVNNMYTCQKAQWHWSPPHGSDFGGPHAGSSTWNINPNGMLFRADVTYGFAMFLCWGAQRFNMIQLLAIKLMVWWYSGGVPA